MVVKSIRTFFLLLAGLVVIAHLIIPHDHHLTGPVEGMKESCPLSHERSSHHPIFPAHCHAFNDLAAEKFTPILVKQETLTSFISVIWRPDTLIAGSHHYANLIENSGKPFPDIYIPDFYPFRAPPASC